MCGSAVAASGFDLCLKYMYARIVVMESDRDACLEM